MMTFHLPEDQAFLAEVGTVAIRHVQLDHILRMTIKTLAGLTVEQAMHATNFQGSSELREQIKKLAKRRLGVRAALLQLQAILERCRLATDRRNDLLHGLIGRELDGEPAMRTRHHEWSPIPKVDELTRLSAELVSLTNELNTARLKGFLAEAIAASNMKV